MPPGFPCVVIQMSRESWWTTVISSYSSLAPIKANMALAIEITVHIETKHMVQIIAVIQVAACRQ